MHEKGETSHKIPAPFTWSFHRWFFSQQLPDIFYINISIVKIYYLLYIEYCYKSIFTDTCASKRICPAGLEFHAKTGFMIQCQIIGGINRLIRHAAYYRYHWLYWWNLGSQLLHSVWCEIYPAYNLKSFVWGNLITDFIVTNVPGVLQLLKLNFRVVIGFQPCLEYAIIP